MNQPVTFVVKDVAAPHRLLAGVSVHVWSGSATVLVGLTDVVGSVTGLLPPGTYEVRAFFPGMRAASWSITVLDDPLAPVVTYDLALELLGATALPTNLRFCRVAGTVVDHEGRGLEGVRFSFTPLSPVYLVDGYGVAGESITAVSDRLGRVTVNLLACAQYDVDTTFATPYNRTVSVPDATQANLLDLIYPSVCSVTWSPDPVVLSVHDVLEITLQVFDQQSVPVNPQQDYQLVVADPSVLAPGSQLYAADGTVTYTVTGLKVGTTTIRVVPRELGIPRIPDPAIVGGTMTVTVNP